MCVCVREGEWERESERDGMRDPEEQRPPNEKEHCECASEKMSEKARVRCNHVTPVKGSEKMAPANPKQVDGRGKGVEELESKTAQTSD